MIDTQSAARAPKRLALLAAAAGLLALSPAAKAQGLFSFPGDRPPSYEIERRLEAGGYELTRRLIPRGDVYLADVAVAGGDAERLVIDRETGRIVERYRLPRAPSPDPAARAWDREDADPWDAPPRPPAGLDRWAPDAALDLPEARQDLPEARQDLPEARQDLPAAHQDLPAARQERRGPTRGQLALGDNAAPPTVIIGRGGGRATSPDLIEIPKAKPLDAKRKATAPAAAVKATAPPSAPSASAAPAAVAAPVVVTAPAANGAVGASPAPPPQAAQAAQADAPAASVATAKPPPSAETPTAPAPAKSKAVNDVPVTPLD
jgi:hypothetical protein